MDDNVSRAVIVRNGFVMAHATSIVYDEADGHFGLVFHRKHRKALATLDGKRVRVVIEAVESTPPPPASDEGREAFQLTLDDYVRTFAAAAMNRSKSMNNTERERVEDNRDILRDRVLALYDRAIVTAALRGKS